MMFLILKSREIFAMKKSNNLQHYIDYYLSCRPAFFSFIRPQEGFLFNKNTRYIQSPILDFGCGDGFFAQMVFGKRTIDIGLDIPESRISEAKDKNIYKKIISYDGGRIPLKDASISTVISNCVFEHLPNLDENIAEISRVLKPGGCLLTSVMTNRWNDFLIGKHIFGLTYIKKFEQQQEHLNLLSLKTWETKLHKNNLKPLQTIGYLNQNTSRLLELAHVFSIPSLITRKACNRWVLFPHWHKPLQLTKVISHILEKSLKTKPAESAALFIVAQKE